jgi:hypothetical protein
MASTNCTASRFFARADCSAPRMPETRTVCTGAPAWASAGCAACASGWVVGAASVLCASAAVLPEARALTSNWWMSFFFIIVPLTCLQIIWHDARPFISN